jgi:transposase
MFGRPSGCIDQLTLVERAAIVTLHGVGWRGRDIAQELHCSENTVSLWLHRWEETRSLDDAERSGRPRCTSDDTDQEIGLYSDARVNALPRDIVRELELTVSARTVRRRRIEIDLHTFVQRHEHAFTGHDLQRRIAYAEGYSNWTAADWGRVMWSDHTLFTLDCQPRAYVTRPPGKACDPKYLAQTERLEGAVWLWGCFCADGLGHAELYEGTLSISSSQLTPSGRAVSGGINKTMHRRTMPEQVGSGFTTMESTSSIFRHGALISTPSSCCGMT